MQYLFCLFLVLFFRVCAFFTFFDKYCVTVTVLLLLYSVRYTKSA